MYRSPDPGMLDPDLGMLALLPLFFRFAVELSGFLHRICFSEFRDAEVEHLNPIATEPVWFEPDVFRFQIAMDDSLLVRFVNSRADLLQNIDHPLQRQTFLLREHVAERATIQIFHHQVSDGFLASVGKTEVGYVNYVWMAETAGRASFAFEAGDELPLRMNWGVMSFRAT